MHAVEVLNRWNLRIGGEPRLSPSSLTLWAEDRAGWAMRYIHRFKEPVSAGLLRGRAVEAGVKSLLYGEPEEKAIEDALRLFDLERGEADLDSEDEEVAAEREATAEMVKQGAAALAARPLPRPTATQARCEAWIDAPTFSAPVAGYPDFCFPGWTLDCKSTHRCPAEPKPNHLAQVACYAKGRNEENAALLYLTPKRYAFYDVGPEEIEAAWSALKLHARSLLRALARAKTAEDFCADCPPPLDSWLWTPERRVAAAGLAEAWA